MNSECLEELWPMANCLWVLNYDPDSTRRCTISNLNPIATQTFRNSQEIIGLLSVLAYLQTKLCGKVNHCHDSIKYKYVKLQIIRLKVSMNAQVLAQNG